MSDEKKDRFTTTSVHMQGPSQAVTPEMLRDLEDGADERLKKGVCITDNSRAQVPDEEIC